MAGVNKTILIGNLGRDPDIRTTQSGDRVAGFTLATSETWRDKATGERKEMTEWHRVVIFTPGLVEVAEKYLKRGSKIYIEGKLRTRKWTDQAGIERFTTEVVLAAFSGVLVMLDRRERDPGADGEDAYGATPSDAGSGPAGSAAPRSRRDDLDDDIPF